MPRILVADDNSNIQKMVALALKDSGVDVVAVPNGEAAVRKLTDTTLDLVLADIFMPVRSGYEVCEYIKLDPRYSHIPVVLLVGAFDPLDEQEAQRVGANGILKKPFVPPDPLINMVKNLLSKSANERLVAVAAPVSAATTAPSKIAPSPAQAAAAFPPKLSANPPVPFPAIADFSDSAPDEFAAPTAVLDFGDHENPVAFGSLLDAPALDEHDLTSTASRDPKLGEPAFWTHPIADEAESDAEEASAKDTTEERSWGTHAKPLPLAVESTTFPGIESEDAFSSLTPAEDSGAGFDRVSSLDEAANENETATPSAAEAENGHALESAPTPLDELGAADSGPDRSLGHLSDLRDAAVELFSIPPIEFTGSDHRAESAAPLAALPVEIEPPAVVHSVSDVTESSEEASAAPVTEREHASPEPAIEPATEPSSKPELSHHAETLAEPETAVPEASELPKVVEIPEIPKAAALPIHAEHAASPEAAPQASIDTQQIAPPPANEAINKPPQEAEPPAAPQIAPTISAPPTLDEMPGWMASVSTILPRIEPALEDAARAHLKSLSNGHGATAETPAEHEAKPDEQPAPEEKAAPALVSAHAKYEALGEPAELSEPSLLTSEWPPAFQPKLSDAVSVEQDAAFSPARIFDVPTNAEPARGISAPTGKSQIDESQSAAGASDTRALTASPQAANGVAPLSGPPSPELVEAIVSRIVARMQPQVIEVVTREVLRPLVEALVRHEIDKD